MDRLRSRATSLLQRLARDLNDIPDHDISQLVRELEQCHPEGVRHTETESEANFTAAPGVTGRKRRQNELERRVQEKDTELQEVNRKLREEIRQRRQAEERLNQEQALRKEKEETICTGQDSEKAEQALRASEERLRLLSLKLVDAQETERKRISQELHDSIGAGLAAIKFSLEKKLAEMKGRSVRQPISLEEIIQKLKTVIEESQRLSRNLHPSILDDLGLTMALRSFCREFQEVYCNIEVEHNISINDAELPADLEILIYRLVQESLNNIAKHSNAELVSLSLLCTEDSLELTVEDNGVGFDAAQALSSENWKKKQGKVGLGLRGMKERTELSGGRFVIHSREGEGTVLQAGWSAKLLNK